MSKLTARQERFCAEYVIDYNATQAAARAGYSVKTAGSQAHDLLKKPEVLARVRALQDEQVRRLAISADWVVQQLVDVYKKCTEPVAVMVWDPERREKVESGAFTFDSKGALNALEQIAKHTGGFNGNGPAETKEITVYFDDGGEAAK